MSHFIRSKRMLPEHVVRKFLRQIGRCMVRALDHLILGPKFGPIPNAKKYVFFPIPDEKFPI